MDQIINKCQPEDRSPNVPEISKQIEEHNLFAKHRICLRRTHSPEITKISLMTLLTARAKLIKIFALSK